MKHQENHQARDNLVLQRTDNQTHFDEIKTSPSDFQHRVELNVTAF